jgi:superfamily I DNA and/or RNA helicase
MLITSNNKFNTISIPNLTIEVWALNNQELINKFFDIMYPLSLWNPTDKTEVQHKLDIVKVYVDEIKNRISTFKEQNNAQALMELAKIVQNKMKEIAKLAESMAIFENEFYSNTLLRIYGMTYRYLNRMEYNKDILKKEIL